MSSCRLFALCCGIAVVATAAAAQPSLNPSLIDAQLRERPVAAVLSPATRRAIARRLVGKPDAEVASTLRYAVGGVPQGGSMRLEAPLLVTLTGPDLGLAMVRNGSRIALGVPGLPTAKAPARLHLFHCRLPFADRVDWRVSGGASGSVAIVDDVATFVAPLRREPGASHDIELTLVGSGQFGIAVQACELSAINS